MARYEVPPDPRESELRVGRKRQMRSGFFDWVSIVGLLLGLIVTIIAIFIAWQMANAFLARESLDVQPVTQPTIMVLTAPPTPTQTRTPRPATATPIPPIVRETPTETPIPDNLPDEVAVGVYGQVANTNGIGVTVRGGPSTDNVRLQLLNEGLVALVIGGPQEGNSFVWWQIQLEDGTEGWVAADFLIPAVPPEEDE